MSGAALLALAGLAAQTAPCRPDVAALTAPALFARFPAQAVAPRRWHAPDVRRGEARLYRTILRRHGEGPADFAGAYKIVGIGCGAGAVCPAVIDGRGGRVIFAPALRSVSATAVDADIAFEILTFRRDSRLLVVIGAPLEDAARRGVSYYDWRDGRPERIGFVGMRDFCAGRGANL